MFLEPTESAQVIDVTNKLQPQFSTVHDDISTALSKETINLIHQPLTYIVNQSFEIGVAKSSQS